MLNKINARSSIACLLVIGSLLLAIRDKNFRSIFGDLAKVGVGGYLGQLAPEKEK
jgi:hypothetical protein